MGLREYHRKRDFSITPEPRGEGDERSREGRSFVIQKHAATRLHYDFRLEMEGVLKSWAVPKGPSYDPKDKRLAMQTEDHPVSYGDFEGIIPKGEYGGGTVLLWDQGTWQPVEDPHQGLRAGALKFDLFGRKMHGRWALVRIKDRDGRDERSWLLVKDRDAHARRASEWSVVDAHPESVTTGRTLEEIARDCDRVWHSNRDPDGAQPRKAAGAKPAARRDWSRRAAAIAGARPSAMPRQLSAQLPTLVDEAPRGDDWVHEMKFDGYRIIASVRGGEARLWSRSGKEWTASFPEVARAVTRLPVGEAVLDGEVAAVLADGTTSFQALQNAAAGSGDGTLVYFLFDLLHLDGHDLTRATLEARKALLAEVAGTVPPDSGLRYSDHVAGEGARFFEKACQLGLEGIISKRRDAPYAAGRGRSWLKVKCLRRQELVIGGYTDPEGSRVGIGALLLGVYEGPGRLVFAGKVGTGFTSRTLQELQRRLAPMGRPTSPFEKPRVPSVTRAHWVEPKLVAEVAFREWTVDGRLRHPSFQGLREDKPAAEVVRERPRDEGEVPPPPPKVARKRKKDKATPIERPPITKAKTGPGGEAEVAGVRITNPGRVLFEEQGVTKLDLARFYDSIADRILPHVSGRPLTLVRCPEGVAKGCFYMKHSGVWAPPALRRVKIQEKTKVGEYLVVEDVAGLVSLAQMGILEIHTWNSAADTVERPDRVVFDLDPDPSVGWEAVVGGARLLKQHLEVLELQSFLKTTGGKGLHVVVPLRPASTWKLSFDFSRALAERMERNDPGHFTTEMPKARRKGRILIDYLRNNRGNTSVAAFSTRARGGAPISAPLAWDELTAKTRPGQYTMANIGRRLARQRKDPWADYGRVRQRITAAMIEALDR